MSLSQIRDEFRVPARLGARVRVRYVSGRPRTGTITGATHDNRVLILYDAGGAS